jgi:hypothetical protein
MSLAANGSLECTVNGYKDDDSLAGTFRLHASTTQNACSSTQTQVKAWIHDHVFGCTEDERNDQTGLCEELSAGNAGTTAHSLGCGLADGYSDHRYWQAGQSTFVDSSNPKLLDAKPCQEEEPYPDPEDPYCIPGSDGTCGTDTPIIIATGLTPRYELTSAADGVVFDINADGVPEKISWTAARAEVAFLAMDRNHDGFINNGSELFGNHTVPGSSNGFDALAKLNIEANGGTTKRTVSSDDVIFSRLLLWTDTNHNGVSEPDELRPAGEIITDIGLAYHHHNRRDGHGNEFKYRGFVDMRTAPGRNRIKGLKTTRRDIAIFTM